MDLDRAVEDVHDDVGGDDLDHRDLAPRLALALRVHLPGGYQGQQASLLDLHPRLGDEVLDELLVGELAAERLALVGAAAHHLDRALAVPIARMQWWMRPGPSRSWAITKPAWRGPSRLASGTRQSS